MAAKKVKYKTLERYIRVLDREIDELQVMLRECQNFIEGLIEQIAAIEQEIEVEQNLIITQDHGEFSSNFGLFLRRRLEKRKDIEQQVHEAQQREIQLQEKIQELFIEKKRYLHVVDNNKLETLQEEGRQEQKLLDEWGMRLS